MARLRSVRTMRTNLLRTKPDLKISIGPNGIVVAREVRELGKTRIVGIRSGHSAAESAWVNLLAAMA